MHPVGPLNPRVYWIRRVLIVVLAVAVLVGVVWFLASRTSRSAAGQEPTAAAVETSAAPTMTGVLAASSGPSRSTVPSPTPTPSPTASPSPATPATDPASTTDPAAPAPADPAAAAAAAAAGPPAEATPPADPAAPAPAAEPAPAPEPSPQPAPPSYDAAGKLICAAESVSVTALTAAPSFAAGSQPVLGMVVTNTGTQPCQQDLSGTIQTFTVSAADGTRMWSTADCFPGEGTEVRELAVGESVKYTIKWSGTTSLPGCVGERATAPAGDYTVVAQLGGLSSPPAAFAITG